jgi:hypothetical protein
MTSRDVVATAHPVYICTIIAVDIHQKEFKDTFIFILHFIFLKLCPALFLLALHPAMLQLLPGLYNTGGQFVFD